jgi:hypothetical protein
LSSNIKTTSSLFCPWVFGPPYGFGIPNSQSRVFIFLPHSGISAFFRKFIVLCRENFFFLQRVSNLLNPGYVFKSLMHVEWYPLGIFWITVWLEMVISFNWANFLSNVG